MAVSKIVLDRQASARVFEFGTTSASGEGLVTIYKGTAAASTLVLDVKGTADIDGDLGVGGNLNVVGDLNITGNINAQSVTDLEVTDRTITLNNGGTTPSDDVAGIEIEGTSAAVIAAIYFRSTSATKLAAGASGSLDDLVGRTATQTLTNKTLTTPTIADLSNATHTHQNAAGGGTLSITAATTGTLTVARGGTGNTTFTAYSVILGGTTATGAFQNVSGLGSSGQVLTSNGAGAIPSWQAVSASSYFQRTTLTGTQDGANKAFTLGDTLTADTDLVTLNGQVLKNGASDNYTISGTTLTFTAGFSAPVAADVIQVWGQY